MRRTATERDQPTSQSVENSVTMTEAEPKRLTDPGWGLPTLRSSVPADLRHLSPARAEVTHWLSDRTSSEQVEDIVLVFSELLTNAITGTASQEQVEYGIETFVGFGPAPRHLRLTVTNHRLAAGSITCGPMPAPTSEDGRGLALAEMFADNLQILLGLDRVEVVATFRLCSDSVWYD